MTPRRERRMSPHSRYSGAASRSRKAVLFWLGERDGVNKWDESIDHDTSIPSRSICINTFLSLLSNPNLQHPPSLDDDAKGCPGGLLLLSSPHGATWGLAASPLLRRPALLLLALKNRKGTIHGAAALGR
jgi:hypothetical protein